MFKVGDFVRFTKENETELFRIEHIGKWLHDKYDNKYNETYCELWQPKEGEWCWFYASTESNPILGIFGGYDEYSKYYQVDISVYGKHSHPSNHRFSYCEPFIGELPSFIKDK